MKSLLLFTLLAFGGHFLLATFSFGAPTDEAEEVNNEQLRRKIYDVYMKLHNRTWREEELPKRVENFWRHRQMILESIKNYTEGRSSYVMKENDFMDMDEEELARLHGARRPSEEVMRREREEAEAENKLPYEGSPANSELPAQIDWRQSACVKKPFNQGDCSNCYATSTIDVVQTMRCIKQGYSPELSYQQIVDCATQEDGYSINGCNGGWMQDVLKYLQEVTYSATNKCYPNVNKEQSCKFQDMFPHADQCLLHGSPTNRERLQYRFLSNAQEMMEAVANVGPIVVGMQSTGNFHYYGEDIYDGVGDCTGNIEDHNHAVVLVGYGSDPQKGDYWILKNSWGEEWGKDGYMYIRRGENTCNIEELGWAVVA